MERDRVLAGGSEVAQSEVDGKPVGPLRVWPGGLAMSRTLGDAPAGDVCTCEPDVRQVCCLEMLIRRFVGLKAAICTGQGWKMKLYLAIRSHYCARHVVWRMMFGLQSSPNKEFCLL